MQRARDALNKFRAEIEKLEQKAKNNEIPEGFKLWEQRKQIKKAAQLFKHLPEGHPIVEILGVPVCEYSKQWRKRYDAFISAVSFVGEIEEKKQETAREFKKLIERLNQLQEETKAGKYSTAKALRIRRAFLKVLHFSPDLLNPEDAKELKNWKGLERKQLQNLKQSKR